MPHYLKEADESQALYQGRWVDKETFRAFVYQDNQKKLVNSYDEYVSCIEDGWFSSKEEVKVERPINIKGRKNKHGTDS